MFARVSAGFAGSPAMGTCGSRPWVVVSSLHMERLARALGDHFAVFAPDLPGSAKEKSDHVLDVAGLAQALSVWLHTCVIPKATFIGDSFGRQVPDDCAMPAINRLPQRAREWVYSGRWNERALGPRRVWQSTAERIRRLFSAAHLCGGFHRLSNGGLMHLAAALGGPWLPQTYLCRVRRLGADRE